VSPTPPAERPAAPQAHVATAVLAVAVAALYASFVRYGVNLDDEGTILYQILRTHRGEQPYLDFHTGYTPAMFYLNSGLLELFGVSVLPLRVFLVAVNTAAVVLIFRLSLRLAPVPESACAALTYALFLPFFAGQFASFNIPYPAWYAVTAWLLAELASVKSIETGRRSWLAAAGAFAGLAFSFKPNTGVLALAAVVLTRLLTAAPLARRIGSWLEGIVLTIAFVAVFAVLGFEVLTEQFLLLGVPLLLLVAGAGWLRGRARNSREHAVFRPVGAGFGDVGVILAGFAFVVATWLGYFLPRLGLDGFAREILLLGAGVERIYLLYYPDVSGWSAAVMAAVVLAWILPRAIARGWIGGRALLVLGFCALVALFLALTLFGLAPEGMILSVALQLENVSYFLIPLLLSAAVVLWLARLAVPGIFRAEGLPIGLGVLTAAIVYGLLLFLQLYPRIDFMHVVIGMPSALVVAAGALWRFERWVLKEIRETVPARFADDRLRLAIRVVALLPIVIGLAARSVPFVDARIALEDDLALREMTRLEFPALPIELERDRDHDLRELAATARFISQSTESGQPIVTFPALALLSFLTDRATPVPHDYFFAGRPSHADEAAMVDQIEDASPPLVVTLNDRLGYFSASPAYYFILRDFVLDNYVLVRRFGRFDVLARRDLAASTPGWDEPVIAGGARSAAFARGRFRDELLAARRMAIRGRAEDLAGYASRLGDVDRGVRGQWAAAFQAVAGREPGGLADVEAVVAPDERSKLLFVRALGEYADTRALPYLQAVFLESGGRIRWEAARSINFVLARKLADRFRLYDPPKGPLWALPDPIPSDETVELIDDFVERQRIGPLAAVATAESGRRDLADELEHFDSDRETTWWRMIASLSLVSLGERQHYRTMLDSLNQGTLAAQYVPSLLLDPDLLPRDEVVAALVETAREGSAEERETVAWMAPYVGAPELRATLETLRSDPDPNVRQAAEWALEVGGPAQEAHARRGETS